MNTQEKFEERATEIHKNDYGYLFFIYINAYTKGPIFCFSCQKFFLQNPHDHLRGRGCPHCRKSYGEKEITRYLDEEKIPYEPQKKLENTRQRWDFYLSKNDIYIEYNGIQHYQIRNAFFDGLAGFCIRVKLDLIK